MAIGDCDVTAIDFGSSRSDFILPLAEALFQNQKSLDCETESLLLSRTHDAEYIWNSLGVVELEIEKLFEP
jgi:hypothetical protein